MRWQNVEMLNSEKSEIVKFCVLPREGVILRFWELFQSRFSISLYIIWLEFAATVDNFHFSVPFSKVFLSGSVRVQLSTFLSLLSGLP